VLVLAWDTATAVMSLALVDFDLSGKSTVVDSRVGDGETNHSALLPPLVQQVLDENSLSMKDLDLLAVGRGPGSFTGLRTALALAKGLGFGAGKPVLGVSSLSALACSHSESVLVAPLIDARHQELFTALFRVAGADEEPEQLSEILVVKPKNLFDVLRNISKTRQSIALIGPALSLAPALQDGFYAGGAEQPQAEAIAKLAFLRYNLGQSDQCPVVPLYGRSPDIFATWKPPKRLNSTPRQQSREQVQSSE
jgi:tRNA threonylcarbamoyladenosine biosynthesis protein TsaB